MTSIHIYPQIELYIQPVSESFTYYGRNSVEHCTLILSADGNYTLYLRPNITSEATVKRDLGYKNALINVTQKMQKNIEDATERYIGMHKDAPTVEDERKKIEEEIRKIKPRRYVRQKCNLAKPHKDEIEEDLTLEAKSLFYNESQDAKNIQGHVSKHLNKLFEERESMWQEAVNLFNRIEDAREEKANAEYQAEANSKMGSLKEKLDGKASMVEPLIESTLQNLIVPYGLNISFDYNENEHSINVQITLADQLTTFCEKATINSANKLSVKSKLVKEINTEITQSALSLVYSVAFRLFKVAANVDTVNIALWKNKSAGYLWIAFTRKSMRGTGPQWVDVLSDYWVHPNVTNFKQKSDSVEILPIAKDTFEHKIKAKKTSVNNSKDEKYCEISVLDAQKILNYMYDPELHEAVENAKSLGSDYVHVEVKYKNILKELNG